MSGQFFTVDFSNSVLLPSTVFAFMNKMYVCPAGASDVLTDTKLTLLFYILGGVLLLLASFVFPWANKVSYNN